MIRLAHGLDNCTLRADRTSVRRVAGKELGLVSAGTQSGASSRSSVSDRFLSRFVSAELGLFRERKTQAGRIQSP